jgi:HAD superfamily hydrolase (TIGR01509 family)
MHFTPSGSEHGKADLMNQSTPSTSQPVRAVVFDMDGLMLDTERIYHHAFGVAGAELGYEVPEALLLATTGRTMPDVYRLFAAHFGADFPLEAFKELWFTRWNEQVSREGIPQKAGLRDLLDWLEAQSIPKAVATSTAQEEARFTLRAGGIAERFAIIVSGDQITHGKPAPDIYLLAAQRLNIPPEECVALEDSEAGVLAATSAGMRTIMVPDIKQPAPEVAARAALIAPSLHEAQAWLQAQRLSVYP